MASHFIRRCRKWGLTPEHLTSQVQIEGKRYVIEGSLPLARANPIVVRRYGTDAFYRTSSDAISSPTNEEMPG